MVKNLYTRNLPLPRYLITWEDVHQTGHKIAVTTKPQTLSDSLCIVMVSV